MLARTTTWSPQPCLIKTMASTSAARANPALSFPATAPSAPLISSWSLVANRPVRGPAPARIWNLLESLSGQDNNVSPDGSKSADEAKFVPLEEEETAFGPPALLLVNLDFLEAQQIRRELDEAGADFIKMLSMSERELELTLWDAMALASQHPQGNQEEEEPLTARATAAANSISRQGQQQAVGAGVRVSVSAGAEGASSGAEQQQQLPVAGRVCIMSGLTSEEIVILIDIVNDLDLQEVAFAAMVAKSAQRSVREVVEDVMGDHRAMLPAQ